MRLFCNLVYSWLVRHADEKDRKRIDGELYAPEDGSDDLSNLLANLGNGDD